MDTLQPPVNQVERHLIDVDDDYAQIQAKCSCSMAPLYEGRDRNRKMQAVYLHLAAVFGYVNPLVAENRRFRAALIAARSDMEGWAAYADEYFREKHNLAADLARIDAVLDAPC